MKTFYLPLIFEGSAKSFLASQWHFISLPLSLSLLVFQVVSGTVKCMPNIWAKFVIKVVRFFTYRMKKMVAPAAQRKDTLSIITNFHFSSFDVFKIPVVHFYVHRLLKNRALQVLFCTDEQKTSFYPISRWRRVYSLTCNLMVGQVSAGYTTFKIVSHPLPTYTQNLMSYYLTVAVDVLGCWKMPQLLSNRQSINSLLIESCNKVSLD